MSNLATLQTAPRFTPENAREMALRSAESKRRKINAQLAQCAKPPIEPEVNRIVKAMSKLPVKSDDYLRLSGILDRLWNKAFPTQGAVKSRQSRRDIEQPLPPPTPQESRTRTESSIP